MNTRLFSVGDKETLKDVDPSEITAVFKSAKLKLVRVSRET